MISLSQLCQAVGGELSGPDVLFQNVAINTRESCMGRLFVALKGEQFDAHDYLPQALSAGAVALMVEQEVSSTLPVVKVASTHQALKDLAAWWRAQLALPVVGITGSVGKTTVKEMIGGIFSQLGNGVVTFGNLNNEIGVPLTLMRLDQDDRFAIVEMGMNHAGEIYRLTQIAQPTIALITNAGEAHLENLGSIAAVAEAKAEIFSGLTPDGIAVVNADDQFADQWRERIGKQRCITFGLTGAADVTAEYRQVKGVLELSVSAPKSTFDIRVQATGEHNVRNALAAIAVALAANLPVEMIQRGLDEYRTPAGRLQFKQFGDNTVIDDTYNANPTSMAAAIDVLAAYPNTTLIIGDMAELGTHTEAAHRRLGQLAREKGVSHLLACGNYSGSVVREFGPNGRSFDSQSALIEFVSATPPDGTILVKGSRSAAMENVVTALQQVLIAMPGQSRKDTNNNKGEGVC